MALTLRSWIAIGALGCATLAVALLPPAPQPEGATRPYEGPEVSARSEIARALRSDYQLALFLRRRDDALAQLREGAGTPLLLVDSRRPTQLTTRNRHALEVATHSIAPRLAPLDTASRLVIFVTPDTEYAAPAGGWVGLGKLVYVYPEGTDGRTCLVIVPTGGIRTLAVDTAGILGPCAYYAAFGRPGPGVAGWLRATHYYSALESDWLSPRPRIEPPGLEDLLAYRSWGQALSLLGHVGLSLDGTGCAAGKLDRCAAYLDQTPWFEGFSQRRTFTFISERWIWWRGRDEYVWYLADLIREMGRDRFGEFWRSPLPRDSAFAAAFGVSMTEWTHRWIASRRPNVRVGSAIRLTSALLGVLLAAILVAGGAYYNSRRQVG